MSFVEFDQCPVCLIEQVEEDDRCFFRCGHGGCKDCVMTVIAIADDVVRCFICKREIKEYRYSTNTDFPVIEILGHRGSGKNIKYLLLWKSRETSYEAIDNLTNCDLLLKEYRRLRHNYAARRYRAKKKIERRSIINGNYISNQ